MEPRHARYPFLDAAREAVEAADVSVADLAVSDAPAVERAVERVERALMAGTVAADDPRRWSVREELLSYPLARILVSLLDVGAAVEKYAEAEAETAVERLREDATAADDLPGVGRLSLADALREFGLAADVRADPGTSRRPDGEPGHYWVALSTYLSLAPTGGPERWRLVNRAVADGEVRVERAGLFDLLREAVRSRVAEGLPFAVRGSPGGDAIADALDDAVADLRELLADRRATGDVDVVAPDLFPPCVDALVERARGGESLPDRSLFSLVAFLLSAGLDGGDVAAFLHAGEGGPEPETLEARVTYLTDRDGSQYPPPSCATMQAYGDCVNMDERCETVSHPLSYYEGAVGDADGVTDWRETQEKGDGGEAA